MLRLEWDLFFLSIWAASLLSGFVEHYSLIPFGEVAAILDEINRQSGTTSISVTHDVNAAMLTGGQALALREGRVVWQGPTAELADHETLEHIFGTTFRFLDDPVTGLRLVAPQGAKP